MRDGESQESLDEAPTSISQALRGWFAVEGISVGNFNFMGAFASCDVDEDGSIGPL